MPFQQGDLVMYKGVQARVTGLATRSCYYIKIDRELLVGEYRKIRWQSNIDHWGGSRGEFKFRVKASSLTPFGTNNREFAKHLLNEQY